MQHADRSTSNHHCGEESCSYLEVSTINSEETLELAVRSWDSRPNLLCKKPKEKGTDVLNVKAPTEATMMIYVSRKVSIFRFDQPAMGQEHGERQDNQDERDYQSQGDDEWIKF